MVLKKESKYQSERHIEERRQLIWVYLLFNTGLVLLCALPVVQFASTAFADYAAFATIRQIFGVQIENLKFFGWWWEKNIFVYIFFALTIVTSIYLWCKPKDAPPDGVEMRDRLRSRRG